MIITSHALGGYLPEKSGLLEGKNRSPSLPPGRSVISSTVSKVRSKEPGPTVFSDTKHRNH